MRCLLLELSPNMTSERGSKYPNRPLIQYESIEALDLASFNNNINVKVLLELLEISRDVNDRPMLEDGQSYQDWENLDKEALTEKYRSVAKLLIAEERQNLRNIQMILFVFIAPLQDLEGVPKQVRLSLYCFEF